MTNEELRTHRKGLTGAGRVQVVRGATFIEVITPYNDYFIQGAKTMGGKWDKERYCWTFPARKLKAVVLFVKEVFDR